MELRLHVYNICRGVPLGLRAIPSHRPPFCDLSSIKSPFGVGQEAYRSSGNIHLLGAKTLWPSLETIPTESVQRNDLILIVDLLIFYIIFKMH